MVIKRHLFHFLLNLWLFLTMINLHGQSSAVDSQTILSYANIPNARLRFSTTCATVNKFISLSDHKSIRLGISAKNIGLTQNKGMRVTGRVFGFGVPITFLHLKNNLSFFGIGAQYEYFTDYKEKIYADPKLVNKDFNSQRVNKHQASVFVEYSPTVKLGFRLGYYFTDFFHEEATGYKTGVWQGIDQSNIFYLSFRCSLICINCDN